MDIKQIQYFVVSADLGSFHAAAKTLITTQPNVSKVIKSLEEELQMTLLKRNRNGVSITPEGERIYRYAMEILRNFKEIRKLKEVGSNEVLSICCAPSNSLAAYVADFYNQYPNKSLQMNFWEGTVEDLIIRVHRRFSELGFIYISNKNRTIFEGGAKSKGLQFHEIVKTPLYLFVGQYNKHYGKEVITESEIHKEKLIQYHEKLYSLYHHLGHLKEDIMYGADKIMIAETNSDHFLIQILKYTDYGSLGSSFTKNKYTEYGLHALPVVNCEESISFGYIKRSKGQLSRVAQQFVEHLQERL